MPLLSHLSALFNRKSAIRNQQFFFIFFIFIFIFIFIIIIIIIFFFSPASSLLRVLRVSVVNLLPPPY